MPESSRHQRDPLILQLVLKLGRGMVSYIYERYFRNAILEAKNFVKMLLFQFSF